MAAACFGRGSICSLHAAPTTSSCLALRSHLWGAQLHLKNDEAYTPTSSPPVMVQVQARLFGRAIFEASKLNVLFLGEGKDTRPDELPRAYTLTHSDITSTLTLAVSQTINEAQIRGWYSRLQRDEVLAEWRKSQGLMSLHVHCHISGDHWLLDVIAHLRFYIFRKELPVVLEAFRYGDVALFKNHPGSMPFSLKESFKYRCKQISTYLMHFDLVEKVELEEALVWVYFHSNEKEYNRVECWGPLQEAAKGCAFEKSTKAIYNAMDKIKEQGSMHSMESSTTLMMGSVGVPSISWSHASGDWKMPMRCPHPCKCCFPTLSIIPLPLSFQNLVNGQANMQRQQHQQEAHLLSSLHKL